jgi:membrane protein implicated in regulation of membrane protease activity
LLVSVFFFCPVTGAAMRSLLVTAHVHALLFSLSLAFFFFSIRAVAVVYAALPLLFNNQQQPSKMTQIPRCVPFRHMSYLV